jgi:hypothetical protein
MTAWALVERSVIPSTGGTVTAFSTVRRGVCGWSRVALAFWILPTENGDVIAVTEPQVWTMIGVFTALMFGMLTIVSTLFVRIVRSEIGGLRSEMSARFDAVHVKIDGLDRDVQLLMSREFGKERD